MMKMVEMQDYGNGDLNIGRHLVVVGSDIKVVHEALTKVDDINELIPRKNFFVAFNDDSRETLLDAVYRYNDSPIKQEIIDLIRSKGGKANCYDGNGRDVGAGNGDINYLKS